MEVIYLDYSLEEGKHKNKYRNSGGQLDTAISSPHDSSQERFVLYFGVHSVGSALILPSIPDY